MTKKEALELLLKNRKPGRPSREMSDSLEKARQVLGLSKSQKLTSEIISKLQQNFQKLKSIKSNKSSNKTTPKVQKPQIIKKFGSNLIEKLGQGTQIVWLWVYYPSKISEKDFAKLEKVIQDLVWTGSGSDLLSGISDMSFEIKNETTAKQIAEKIKSLEIKNLQVEIQYLRPNPEITPHECADDETDSQGDCLGFCLECGEHVRVLGDSDPYCPVCNVCEECGSPQVDDLDHYPKCPLAQDTDDSDYVEKDYEEDDEDLEDEESEDWKNP